MKIKRRGRKPKDKFKYEISEYDELQKNSNKDENIIIKGTHFIFLHNISNIP